MDSIFQLADLYTSTATADEYASFLRRLLPECCLPGGDAIGNPIFWRQARLGRKGLFRPLRAALQMVRATSKSSAVAPGAATGDAELGAMQGVMQEVADGSTAGWCLPPIRQASMSVSSTEASPYDAPMHVSHGFEPTGSDLYGCMGRANDASSRDQHGGQSGVPYGSRVPKSAYARPLPQPRRAVPQLNSSAERGDRRGDQRSDWRGDQRDDQRDDRRSGTWIPTGAADLLGRPSPYMDNGPYDHEPHAKASGHGGQRVWRAGGAPGHLNGSDLYMDWSDRSPEEVRELETQAMTKARRRQRRQAQQERHAVVLIQSHARTKAQQGAYTDERDARREAARTIQRVVRAQWGEADEMLQDLDEERAMRGDSAGSSLASGSQPASIPASRRGPRHASVLECARGDTTAGSEALQDSTAAGAQPILPKAQRKPEGDAFLFVFPRPHSLPSLRVSSRSISTPPVVWTPSGATLTGRSHPKWRGSMASWEADIMATGIGKRLGRPMRPSRAGGRVDATHALAELAARSVPRHCCSADGAASVATHVGAAQLPCSASVPLLSRCTCTPVADGAQITAQAVGTGNGGREDWPARSTSPAMTSSPPLPLYLVAIKDYKYLVRSV